MSEYRGASLADIDSIARLHTDSWRRAYRGMYRDDFLDGDLIGNRRRVWSERLERPPSNQFVLVAVAQEEVVGFVCGYGEEDTEWGSLIDNLHVSEGFQRRGIASALMTRAGSWLATHYAGCGVYLWVLEANTAARRFYEALGATNAETVHNEVHPGGWAMSCRYVWHSPTLLAGAV